MQLLKAIKRIVTQYKSEYQAIQLTELKTENRELTT